MKYLLLDTNIYIDMIVSRDESHKPESYDNLKKILEFTNTKLLVPQIIKHELFRHIENEINKIGNDLKKSKSIIDKLYWINQISELNEFKNNKEVISSNLRDLIKEFETKKDSHINHYKLQFDNLFKHRNVITIEENHKILDSVAKRRLYKLRPFHSNDKDSNADAVIIETILNIEDFITGFSEEDKIYFISKNYSDFSSKENRDKLHSDISKDIDSKLRDNFYYSRFFTKLLLTEFREEIDLADIEIDQLEAEAEAESILHQQYLIDLDREVVGLDSLSSSSYEYKIIDSKELHNLVEAIYDSLESINDKIDELYDILYTKTDSDAISKLEDKLSHLDFLDSIDLDKFTSIYDDIFTVSDWKDNNYCLKIEGSISPSNDDFDFLDVNLYKNGNAISKGSIEIYYGFVQFDDSGNVQDASEDSIVFYLEPIYTELENLLSQINNYISNIESDIKKTL